MRRTTIATIGIVALTAGVAGPALGAAPIGSATTTGGSVPTCHGKPATIVGTNDRDVIIGTPGNDVIVGLRGWDRLHGAGGNDTICGGRGADHLYGGTGSDRLDGQGDGLLFDEDQYGDSVDGGPGDDTISGGGGLYAHDRGLDVLVYPQHVAPLRVDLHAKVARFDGQRDRVLNIEYVNGSDFADTLTGDRYFNFLSGYGGDDRLVGNGGIDFLDGGDGNDLAKGGGGDDLLDGGAGTDHANGGDGEDYCNSFESWIACEHM